eukprot:3352726-Amphidinium_carterae.1
MILRSTCPRHSTDSTTERDVADGRRCVLPVDVVTLNSHELDMFGVEGQRAIIMNGVVDISRFVVHPDPSCPIVRSCPVV